jgi:hypothetical protein
MDGYTSKAGKPCNNRDAESVHFKKKIRGCWYRAVDVHVYKLYMNHIERKSLIYLTQSFEINDSDKNGLCLE